jgi:hypothetical protein
MNMDSRELANALAEKAKAQQFKHTKNNKVLASCGSHATMLLIHNRE